jgi:hypothetical protein
MVVVTKFISFPVFSFPASIGTFCLDKTPTLPTTINEVKGTDQDRNQYNSSYSSTGNRTSKVGT